MTEDEAKTKWCPFVRVVEKHKDGNTNARNRVVLIDQGEPLISQLVGAQCIGSECMAWRWTDTLSVPQKHRRGCCGLAGRP